MSLQSKTTGIQLFGEAADFNKKTNSRDYRSMSKRHLPSRHVKSTEREEDRSVSPVTSEAETLNSQTSTAFEMNQMAQLIIQMQKSNEEAAAARREEREQRREDKERARKREEEATEIRRRLEVEAAAARREEKALRRQQQEATLQELREREDARREDDIRRAEVQLQGDREFQLQLRKEDLTRLEEKNELERQRRRNKIAHEIPPMSKLRDPREIVHFLGGFERHMEKYGVDRDQWAVLLKPLLDAKTANFMDRLTPQIQDDHALLCKSLIEYSGINQEYYRKKWEGLAWKDRTPPMEAYMNVYEVGQSWTKDCKTRDDGIDHFIREKFISIMPPAASAWVREREPKTGRQAAELAVTYFAARADSETQPRRQQPFQRGQNNLRPNPYAGRSYPGRDGAGTEPDNPPSTRRQQDRDNVSRCYRCDKIGHRANQCPERQANIKNEKPAIQEAKIAELHDNQELPVFAGSINRRPATRLVRDSGCTHSIIHQRLVDPKFKDEGNAPVRCIHGDTKPLPTTTVRLKLCGRRWDVNMAVTDLGSYDAMLGNDIPNLDRMITIKKHIRNKKKRRNPTRACGRPKTYRETSSSSEATSSDSSETRSSDGDDSPPADCSSRAVSGSELTRPTPPTSDTNGEGHSSADSSSGRQSDYGGTRRSCTSDKQTSTQDDSESPGENEDSNTSQSDQALQTASARGKKKKKSRRPLQEQQYAQKWGTTIDLNGGQTQMRELQEEDSSLATARANVTKKNSKFFRGADDGLLYRRGSMPGDKHEECKQLVLPKQYRENTLRMAHIAPLAGHFGVAKTSSRIKQRFFWPGMRQDIQDLCKRCQTCQLTTPKYSPKAPLVPLPIIRTPFTRLAMDMIGPLPPTKEGHKYILTVCDYGTRYPEAFPLKSTTSKDVAEALVEMFSRTGIPDEILTDRGSNFTSDLMAEFYRLLGIKSILTSAYHPQTDGMVERFNGTLKAGIRKFITAHEGEWHKALPYILFAYRETPHTTTGFSPFELVFGRNPKGPLDVLRKQWTGSNSASSDVVSFLTETYQRLEKAKAAATHKEQAAKSAMKTYYDKGAKSQIFEVGDLVLILKPTTKVKLHAQWQGPYSVVTRLSDTTYAVKKLNSNSGTRTYHTNFLKRWESPSAVCMMTLDEEQMDDLPAWEMHPDEGEVTVGKDIKPEQAKQLRSLLKEYKDVFSNTAGATKLAEMEIDTGEAKPVYTPPYRVAHSQLPKVKIEVQNMLEAGIISPSKSAWASPLLMVKKKDGTLRPVVDYRRLNKLTKPDPFPMPRIDDLIDGLAGARFISTLDLTKGYWQVPVAEADKPKTAFVAPMGKYQFNFMPFGLMGAPSTFQRLMNNIFHDVADHVAAYIDDVVVYSSTWEQHVEHLRETLERLRDAGLKVKARKCQMAMSECLFLGHMVGRGQVRPDEAKIDDVRNFKTPKSKKDVRSFLGLAGYYRRFVEDFASVATPLSDLTKDCCQDKVSWEPQHQRAFDRLKEVLTSEPVLQGPDYEKTFHLQTDASNHGIGAVLSQMSEDGADRPVAYYSRKLLKSEKNYAAVDKECLAIVDSIKHFQIYLTGIKFVVKTDHKCLQWLDSVKDTGGRRTRWSLRLQPFQFDVVHRPGVENGNADGLSRQAWKEEGEEQRGEEEQEIAHETDQEIVHETDVPTRNGAGGSVVNSLITRSSPQP